ncbi:MAG: hypothetical protein ACOC0Z_08375 [Halohasta sp.]
MQPTRRRCLAITGVGIGVAVGGCLSSGSNINYPEPPDDEDDGSDADSNESNDSDDDEGEDEVEPINTRLADETDEIYEELRWFETEYEDMRIDYKGRLREVYNELKDLRETLAEDGRIEETQLESVQTLAEDVADTVNDIPGDRFTGHVDFEQVNENNFPEADKFRRREDWDRVDDELRDLERVYGRTSTDEEIRERYSPNPIDNRLYGWFAPETENRMFEVRHISDDPADHEDDDQRLPGHGAYVVEDSEREIEYLDRPLGGPRWELLSSLNDDFDEFDEPTNRRYRLYVRLHDVDDDGEIDPTETDSVPVFAQRYEDVEAADAAVTAVMSDKVVEDTVEWGDEEWDRALFDDDGDRIYVHVLQAGAFLFAVNPSETAWEERDDDWDRPIDGTWINPEL